MTRKLMFVVNVDWFFISHRLPIALEAKRQGFEVHIATGLTDKLEELQGYGLVVHPLRLDRSSTGVVNAWRTGLELWRLFKAVRPDVVHLVTIKPVLLGGLVARLAGVSAVVVAVSGLGFVFTASGVMASVRRWLVGALYRVALGHRNLRVIFQNPDDRACLGEMAHLQDSQVVMIRGSGVNLAQYTQMPLPPGLPVVLLAARLLADKGVREFVQVARLLRQQGVRARFCLVGCIDPDNPASLTDAELEQWAQEAVVELWGQRSDMPAVLSAAHVVVLPSYREGLPKVLLEAAACARAVVTTDVPGCRDAIDAGVTGELVPARNVQALAQAIKNLVNDPVRCQIMGQAGRALAERAFDVRQVVAAHLRIYDALTGLPTKRVEPRVLQRRNSPAPSIISVSVVSHDQLHLIAGLMQDIQCCCRDTQLELILTLNLDELLTFDAEDFFFPVKVIRNRTSKGFSTNHNQAFKQAQGQFFCVVNPDIRFKTNPFPALLACFKNAHVGVAAPVVVGISGELEDSVRCFPTPLIILTKVLAWHAPSKNTWTTKTMAPDWVAGMFMLFPCYVFDELRGFDERYFLYYEDVDLCGRLQLAGYNVAVCPQSQVIHHAQRTSHRSLRYLLWHIGSMLRFFLSPVYRRLKSRRQS